MTKQIFINPQTIEKIEKKVDQICKAYDVSNDRTWQVWQMVATIESGFATITSYHDDGILVGNWNKKLNGEVDANPISAWGGFYRNEKAQWAGYIIYLTSICDGDKAIEMDRLATIYGYTGRLFWEDEIKVWGYAAWQDCYTASEAEALYKLESRKKGFKWGNVELKEQTGCWRVKVENSRTKPGLENCYRERIVK